MLELQIESLTLTLAKQIGNTHAHVCVYIWVSVWDWRQLIGAGSLFPHCGAQGLNSDCQAWQQTRLLCNPSQ